MPTPRQPAAPRTPKECARTCLSESLAKIADAANTDPNAEAPSIDGKEPVFAYANPPERNNKTDDEVAR